MSQLHSETKFPATKYVKIDHYHPPSIFDEQPLHQTRRRQHVQQASTLPLPNSHTLPIAERQIGRTRPPGRRQRPSRNGSNRSRPPVARLQNSTTTPPTLRTPNHTSLF